MTPYRLGRAWTGELTDLVIYNVTRVAVPGEEGAVRPAALRRAVLRCALLWHDAMRCCDGGR